MIYKNDIQYITKIFVAVLAINALIAYFIKIKILIRYQRRKTLNN